MSGARDWFVIHCRPRKEDYVRRQVEQYGCEIFMPLIRERRPGCRKSYLAPLFPGYLFGLLEVSRGDLSRVRWMSGVNRVLGGRNEPRPIAPGVVEMIRKRSTAAGVFSGGRCLRRNQQVRIIDGPFTGMIGSLEKQASRPGDRIAVLLDLFNQATLVECSEDSVVGLMARAG